MIFVQSEADYLELVPHVRSPITYTPLQRGRFYVHRGTMFQIFQDLEPQFFKTFQYVFQIFQVMFQIFHDLEPQFFQNV